MSYANETSASDSATTRPTAPPPKAKSTRQAKRELTDLSEVDFLKAQEANAKAAITATLREMKDDLVKAANVRYVYEQHPWLTTAGAAVAGFVTAAAVVPSKEESALKKLARWEEALREAEGRATQADAASTGDGDAKPPVKQGQKGLLAALAAGAV